MAQKLYKTAQGRLAWYNEGEQPKGAMLATDVKKQADKKQASEVLNKAKKQVANKKA